MRDVRQVQTDSDRRWRRAEADARRGAAAGLQAGTACEPFRCGVAEIVCNDGGGAYTVTEQWHDAAEPPAWTDAAGAGVLAEAPARDFGDRTDGDPGDLVFFWQQRRGGGQIETLLDVGPAADGLVERVKVAYHWKDDGTPNPTTDVVTVDERDWRGYWVLVMGHCGYGPPSGMNDAGNCKAPTAGGSYQHWHKVDDVNANLEYAYWGIGSNLLQGTLFVDGPDGGKLKLRFKNLTGVPAEMSFYAWLDIYRASTPTTGYAPVGDNH